MSDAVEIERKFLLDFLPQGVAALAGTGIRQGYLAVSESAEVRLRDKGGRFFLTVKSSGGLRRSEHEVELNEKQFAGLWPATAGRRVEKTRYGMPFAELLIEIDHYHGALDGLLTAEVEFASEEEAQRFDAPSWFAEEVTEDSRYKNRQLALAGRPE